MIREYKHSALTGRPCMIENGFIPSMDIICATAEKHKIKIYITSSFRTDLVVPGAIVDPAEKGNHLAGHAIDCNLIDSAGKWWNHVALDNPTGDVLAFITEVTEAGVRWGGAFQKKDDVHFDDGLNLKDPQRWKEIYSEVHKAA